MSDVTVSDNWLRKPVTEQDKAWYEGQIRTQLCYLRDLIKRYNLDAKHGVERYKPRTLEGGFVASGTHMQYNFFLSEIIDMIRRAWADGGNMTRHPKIEECPPWIVF